MQKLNPVPLLIVAIFMSGTVTANDNPDFRYWVPNACAQAFALGPLGQVADNSSENLLQLV